MAPTHKKISTFADLFDTYYDDIYAYAYRRIGDRMAAEDVAACTFEDALRGMQRIHSAVPPELPWLYRIASRRVVDYYRRISREHRLSLRAEPPMDQGERLEQAERDEQVRSRLAKLSESDQEILLLAFFEEQSAGEIAKVLGLQSAAVYVRLHRALRRLQKTLEAEE